MGGRTSNESKAKYNAKAYDRINIAVPKGRKEVLQMEAERRGQSVNGFINSLIDKALTTESAEPGGGFGIPGQSPGEYCCSWLITLLGDSFLSAVEASGQSSEQYLLQAVHDRIERDGFSR